MDDVHKLRFIRLLFVSSMLLFFTVLAAVLIVCWTPVIATADAADIDHAKKRPLSEYVALHESATYMAGLQLHTETSDCTK